MSRVLRQQVAAFRSEVLIESIAWSGIRSLSACERSCLLVILLPPWSTFLRLPLLTILCAFFTAAATEDVVSKVARGAKLPLIIFSRHSVQLDYSRCLSLGRAGTTAAIVAFRGKGAKLQYAELVMTAQASIAFAGDVLHT